MAVHSLEDIGQQMKQLEAQLTALRSNYQTRQRDVERLQKYKKELQEQLHQVEGRIATLEQGTITKGASTKKENAKKSTGTGTKSTSTKAPQKDKPTPGQPMLRDVIINLLKQAGKPLPTRELAEQALAAGYQTRSKNFPAVVQDVLKRIDKIERIPGEGYQLKRG